HRIFYPCRINRLEDGAVHLRNRCKQIVDQIQNVRRIVHQTSPSFKRIRSPGVGLFLGDHRAVRFSYKMVDIAKPATVDKPSHLRKVSDKLVVIPYLVDQAAAFREHHELFSLGCIQTEWFFSKYMYASFKKILHDRSMKF